MNKNEKHTPPEDDVDDAVMLARLLLIRDEQSGNADGPSNSVLSQRLESLVAELNAAEHLEQARLTIAALHYSSTCSSKYSAVTTNTSSSSLSQKSC